MLSGHFTTVAAVGQNAGQDVAFAGSGHADRISSSPRKLLLEQLAVFGVHFVEAAASFLGGH